MTEAEKKMKKYVNAVERRLNLPRDIKVRVMSDLLSSISARREAGRTDEEIYAEFGTPKAAAADLNQQMEEFAYRKSPWRFVFLAAAVYGGYQIFGDLLMRLYMFFWLKDSMAVSSSAASVGIIGGADGPTAIFVTSPLWTFYIMPLVLLIVGILGFYRLRKCKKK